MGSAICSGKLDFISLVKAHCPSCKKQRSFLFEMWEWYGRYSTCLKCGEKFFEGEMMERPFSPGWRQKNINAAKKLYRRFLKAANSKPVPKV